VHRPAVDLYPVARPVEDEPTDAHDTGAASLQLLPAQQCTDAAHELLRRERLHDVIVGPELEPEHAIDL
jgi:hypothetical protein